ncbi:hypothetical protein JL100_035180 (plasmid) [Skermanella mucosa]|uniref:hypothetical protein n=1 Tax=Skermanella mucosa TaxID=1789672 RepID=UPI00192B0C3E|nr:hypothetical protein [Skermanella mucosa]UEM25305.1 hypothetical protein JL100_035180 [Skermanella mucosa]
MPSRKRANDQDFLRAELQGAILEAISSGQHCDHDLLVLHEHFRGTGWVPPDPRGQGEASAPAGETLRRDLLRSMASLPARSVLGIAAKLAVACQLNGHFEAAREAPDGPDGSHVVVSAFIDIVIQYRLLQEHPPSGSQPSRH